MFVLVKHVVTTGEFATSKTFTDYNKALEEFYEILKNNIADVTVKRVDVVILNDSLVPCKSEHYSREVEQVEEPVE